MEDLISVIVAAYNIEKYLPACIESIENQTYKNLEIIIVNDGSTDRVHDITLEYKNRDSRIVLLDKENGGLSDARNAGIQMAKGKYIVIIDGDDTIHPDMIQKLHEQIVEHNADLAICNVMVVDEQMQQIQDLAEIPFKTELISKEEMFERITFERSWTFVVAWNKLYKKELFNSVKYYKNKIHEDELIIHHIVGNCERIALLEDKLYFYVQRKQSITHSGYKVKHLDKVEAYGNRAEYFVNLKDFDRAFRMIVRMRTALLDGLIALRKDKSKNKKVRVSELYLYFCDICSRIDFDRINSDKKTQVKLMTKSLWLALVTSGNYWHSFKYR